MVLLAAIEAKLCAARALHDIIRASRAGKLDRVAARGVRARGELLVLVHEALFGENED